MADYELNTMNQKGAERAIYVLPNLRLYCSLFLMTLVFFWKNKGFHRDMINKALFTAGFSTLDERNNYIDKSILILCSRKSSEYDKKAALYRLKEDTEEPFKSSVNFMLENAKDLEDTLKKRYV